MQEEKKIKFLWNGIKVDGVLHRVYYSVGGYLKRPEGTVCVYGRDYKRLPKIDDVEITNGSDSMSDYFEDDKFFVEPGHRFYSEILAAIEAGREHGKKIMERAAKRRADLRAAAERRRAEMSIVPEMAYNW